MKIEDCTALVTGANRGIGREIVLALVRAGARRVYAGARRRDTLDSLVSTHPGKIVPIELDITDADGVAAAAARAGDVRLLVNNAGVLDFGDILAAPVEAVRRNVDTNFYGTLTMARQFAPVIEGNGGGAIVNVLTLVALASMPGLAVYNASKAASWSMTQSMRATLGSRGIDVFGVFPAGVDTDMLAGVDTTKAAPADVAREIVQGIAAGEEDIFPDPVSKQAYAHWRADHKAVERQFAAM